MAILSCCFTGHRQIPVAELAPLTFHLDAALAALYDNGCRSFYAGGARGFDTLAASRVLLLREQHPDVRLFLLLPCRNQTAGWSGEDAMRFDEILSLSDGYRYMQEEYSTTAIVARNRALVEEGEVCIAYVRRSASGSGQTLRVAQEKERAFINLADRFCASEIS